MKQKLLAPPHTCREDVARTLANRGKRPTAVSGHTQAEDSSSGDSKNRMDHVSDKKHLMSNDITDCTIINIVFLVDLRPQVSLAR